MIMSIFLECFGLYHVVEYCVLVVVCSVVEFCGGSVVL